METLFLTVLGISIPTAALPGIGASIRTFTAARLSAISSARFVILLIRTPEAGLSSYRVTVGPLEISVISACTPNDARVSTKSSAFVFSSPEISFADLCLTALRILTSGSLYSLTADFISSSVTTNSPTGSCGFSVLGSGAFSPSLASFTISSSDLISSLRFLFLLAEAFISSISSL